MNLKKDRTPPLWAVLGAPLLGVPLMVGLLALVAPRVDEPVAEPVPVLVTEPVDTDYVEPTSNDSAAQTERELQVG
ncbi:MAG: hypothetical protein OEO79_11695 [Gemmatimonadota bacterium]|nr:hypothetical protein [Gemmatimonadota bacterium]MDH3422855.1 hypothetical protein [Gemmatimonadota bacterium]